MLSRRTTVADAVGLGALLLLLLDYLRPSLLLLPTIAAGGDTPCHYPTAVFFHEQILPRLRFHGWYPGAYMGHPLLLYYFPLPFFVMSLLAPLTGMPVAFKLGTVLGVFALPLLTYASFRLMGFRFPSPLLASAASVVFLFLEENPIWGGTLASTLAGEFSYTYGIGLAVLFFGVVYRCYARGSRGWVPGVVLALTALAHGYAVLWAGLSAAYFLYAARRPERTILWLLRVAALALAFAGFWLVPLLADWGWTTPYDDPWITISPKNLLPPYLAPLLILALAGLVGTLLLARRSGGPDHRLLFLAHAALVAIALAAAGPALGVIDVRFVPFAQLALCLMGGATAGLLLQRMAQAPIAAVGLVLLAVVYADASSGVLRHWIEYNYTGLEAKEHWPAFRELSDRLKGGVGDPRVAVEYGVEHERAGSIRMYETVPHFSGRSTLEGVYNQASLQTHAVYYVASELGVSSPNPFKKREYSRFDTDNALRHLRLFNVREIVALSPGLRQSLEGRNDVELLARVPPYTVFRLKDSGSAYVEPFSHEPVRSVPHEWREKSYRWFTRKPLSPVHLVFTDDPRFATLERDEWVAPPGVPLPAGVDVRETVTAEEITITTNRIGHPLLVKVSHHPRWKAEGAEGPYLVSPALMMVVPRQTHVRLYYGRTWADFLGLALTLGSVAVAGWAAFRRGTAAPAAAPSPSPMERAKTDACELPASPRRWGGIVPGTLLVLLAAARLVGQTAPSAQEGADLYARASRAYAEEAYEDAAEYARHALARTDDAALLAELHCLRGESLLRVDRAREAIEAFEAVIRSGSSPYLPQALFGLQRARARLGDEAGEREARERLLREHPDTPWARRARTHVR